MMVWCEFCGKDKLYEMADEHNHDYEDGMEPRCSFSIDPFEFELSGDETKHWICDRCWIDRRDDV
jgi:hypothetical protein